MTYRNYWAVYGRLCGDWEDHARFYEQTTREDAIELFKLDLYQAENMGPDDIALAEANGEGVFVNLVLASDSPIEEM